MPEADGKEHPAQTSTEPTAGEHQWSRQFGVSLTEADVRMAAWRCWLRLCGGYVLILIVALLIGLMAFGAREQLSPTDNILFGVMLGASTYGLIGLAAHCIALMRNWVRALRGSMLPTWYEFSEAGVVWRSPMLGCRLRWQGFKSLWRYPGLWLLRIGETGFLILPTRDLDKELQTFIEATVRIVRAKGLCVKCKYDLRGQAQPRCPECGEPIEPEALAVLRSMT